MNRKVLFLIIGLVAVVPLVAYANSLSDSLLIVKAYDTLPDCNSSVEGAIVYYKGSKNIVICNSESWQLPDGLKI